MYTTKTCSAILLCVTIFVCSQQQATAGIHAPGDTIVYETPVKIADTFSFTEGPAVDRSGNVYFTDQPNNRILKYDLDGRLTVFMQPAGRSNGMYVDAAGNLISCADEKDQLWSISPDKEVTVLIKDFNGARMNGPNDVWIAPDGGMYLTDPYYQRDYWKRQAPDPAIKGRYVYYLPKGSRTLQPVDTTLQQPNGIVGTPDGKHLYVADIKAGKTYRYDIGEKGQLIHKQLFAPMGSDGMTIDSQGNIYLTGKGVTVFNPQGEKIGHIPIPEPWSANVCFYGKDRQYLFVTASKTVYLVKMAIPGNL